MVVKNEEYTMNKSTNGFSIKLVGVLSLVITLLAIFSKQDLGPFANSGFSDFSSEGDFWRYNELVHKPLTAIIFFIHAITLFIIDRPVYSNFLKVFYYLLGASLLIFSFQFSDYIMLAGTILIFVVAIKSIGRRPDGI